MGNPAGVRRKKKEKRRKKEHQKSRDRSPAQTDVGPSAEIRGQRRAAG